ncbi:hypothetical protein ASG65_23890 [Bacillus sp. Leaf13]|nr:hypothetical protein ASG65_23890 [Bacillus sp. Leaf13]
MVFIIVFIILGILLEKTINKLLGVEKKKISGTSGKIVDQWGRGVILVIFLCTFPSVSTNDMNWLLILYFFLLLGFQSILEWKYLKNSKQYVTTLIFLILGVIIMYNIECFFQLLG